MNSTTFRKIVIFVINVSKNLATTYKTTPFHSHKTTLTESLPKQPQIFFVIYLLRNENTGISIRILEPEDCRNVFITITVKPQLSVIIGNSSYPLKIRKVGYINTRAKIKDKQEVLVTTFPT
jgi:hypothetical protein